MSNDKTKRTPVEIAARSGIKTTEFWVTLAVIAGSIAGSIAVAPVAAPVAAVAGSVAAASTAIAYVLSRGKVKLELAKRQ